MYKKIICAVLALFVVSMGFVIPSSAAYDPDAVAMEIIARVNAERINVNSPVVKSSPDLNAIARERVEELKEKFEHTRPNGGTPYSILTEYGISFTAAAENIAYDGIGTAAFVMDLWMNSAGHKANLLNSVYTHVGVACSYDVSTRRYYSVQLFVKNTNGYKGEFSVAPYDSSKDTTKAIPTTTTVKSTTTTTTVMPTTTTTTTVKPTTTETTVARTSIAGVKYGDINDDGSINSKDSLVLKQFNAGISVKNFNGKAADVNLDGSINSKDSLVLKKYNAGIIPTLPYVG